MQIKNGGLWRKISETLIGCNLKTVAAIDLNLKVSDIISNMLKPVNLE